jgi:hypothetical protein
VFSATDQIIKHLDMGVLPLSVADVCNMCAVIFVDCVMLLQTRSIPSRIFTILSDVSELLIVKTSQPGHAIWSKYLPQMTIYCMLPRIILPAAFHVGIERFAFLFELCHMLKSFYWTPSGLSALQGRTTIV